LIEEINRVINNGGKIEDLKGSNIKTRVMKDILVLGKGNQEECRIRIKKCLVRM